jgi:hypothetical protein
MGAGQRLGNGRATEVRHRAQSKLDVVTTSAASAGSVGDLRETIIGVIGSAINRPAVEAVVHQVAGLEDGIARQIRDRIMGALDEDLTPMQPDEFP